jgi:hypothetical protein
MLLLWSEAEGAQGGRKKEVKVGRGGISGWEGDAVSSCDGLWRSSEGIIAPCGWKNIVYLTVTQVRILLGLILLDLCLAPSGRISDVRGVLRKATRLRTVRRVRVLWDWTLDVERTLNYYVWNCTL